MKLKTKLLLMALMPMILMIVIIAGILLIEIPVLNGSSAEEGLKTAAYSVSAGLNAMDGDFKVTRGQLYKGNIVFANDNALFTEINEKTGAEIVLFYGIDSYATTIKDSEGNYVKKLTADEQTVDTVKSMDGYLFDRNAEYADCKYYGCYVPLKQGSSGVNVGMIFVGIPKNNVRKGMFIGLIISAVLVIAVIVVSVIITLRDAKRLVKAVVSCNKAAERLASGELDVRVDDDTLKRDDELGMLGKSNAKLADTLRDIVSEAKHCTAELGEASANLKKVSMDSTVAIRNVKTSVNEINRATSSQAEDTETASEHVGVISNAINDTATEVENLDANSEAMKNKSAEALAILEDLKQITDEAGSAIQVIYDQTNKTNSSAKSIEEAVNLISDIANQTNLLSLNASIEAARAGEAGQGFAVVATEISALAEQTNNSAHTIQGIIASLMNDSNSAVETMDKVKEIIIKQNDNVVRTVNIFNELEENINITVETSGKISEEVKALGEARNVVEEALHNLSAVAVENAAGTEETSASMDKVGSVINKVSAAAMSLSNMSERLDMTMSAFNLDE
ncbi:MAG: cache domain-containing protein [Lachnospiraceae bacterium]|nr:cache domain-containing protein [Lachnospiraceae bacterium]